MRISMEIIYENLAEFRPSGRKRRGWNEMRYLGFTPMGKKMRDLAEEFVILGRAEELEAAELPEKSGIICLGTPRGTLDKAQRWILLPETARWEEVCCALLITFRKYQLWEEALMEALRRNERIESYCQASVDIFENPIFVHDGDFEIIASVNEMPEQVKWNYESQTGKKTVQMETMNEFKVSREYQDSLKTRGAQIFPRQQFGYRGLYVNFWTEETFLGRICVNELGREFRESDYPLLEYLAGHVQTALERGCLLQSDDPRDLEQSFYELLQHGHTEETVLKKRLEYQKWKPGDRFLCIRLLVSSRDFSTHAVYFTCRRLENMFAGIYAFHYHEGIVIVLNMEKINSDISEFFQRFAVFMREGLFKAGISCQGDDFMELKFYYQQCLAALEMGEKENPMFWMYKFEDYVLSYLFYQGSRKLLPQMYCEPGLLKLKSYDEEHSTEFFKTLYIYLVNDRNIAHTSGRLYIHRSTLLYRLEKIKKILELNLDEYKVRFRLLLSYEILEWTQNE